MGPQWVPIGDPLGFNLGESMNTDIRISVSFKNHRKRKKLRLFLGDGATDYLIDLWLTVAVERPGGVLHGLDETDLALMAGWGGDPALFVDGLNRAGFLDVDADGVYSLHDWQDHNGYASSAEDRSAKGRFNSFKRWNPEKAAELECMGITGLSAEEFKDLKSQPKRGTLGVLMGTQRDPIGGAIGIPNAPTPTPTPNPKPIKKPKGPSEAGSGFVLPDWVPLVEWSAYVEMRRKTKKPMTEHAKSLLVLKLEKLRDAGEDPSVVLNEATSRNWLSVYPVKGGEYGGSGNGGHSAGAAASRGKTEDARARVGLAPAIGGKGDFVGDFPDHAAEW